MRLLVVEDEANLRKQLASQIRAEGMVVDCAADASEAAYFCREFPLDAAVIDLGLPDLDGVELIRRLRGDGISLPILVLTARDGWEQKVAALEAGADDYVTKPFVMAEVMARLQALLRRSAGWAENTLRCGPLTLDLGSGGVTVHGEPMTLTDYEYRLLRLLMVHAGEVLSKMRLTEHLYEDEAQRDSNVLEVLISRLRTKLDPDGTLQPIQTLRGRGYCLRLPRDG